MKGSGEGVRRCGPGWGGPGKMERGGGVEGRGGSTLRPSRWGAVQVGAVRAAAVRVGVVRVGPEESFVELRVFFMVFHELV